MSSPGAEPCGEELKNLSAEKREDFLIIRRNSLPPRPAYHGRIPLPVAPGVGGCRGAGAKPPAKKPPGQFPQQSYGAKSSKKIRDCDKCGVYADRL